MISLVFCRIRSSSSALQLLQQLSLSCLQSLDLLLQLLIFRLGQATRGNAFHILLVADLSSFLFQIAQSAFEICVFCEKAASDDLILTIALFAIIEEDLF